MPGRQSNSQTNLITVGWQGVTAEIPNDWHIGAISGDASGGYVRYDDDDMPRLEIKWASESGFVDLNTVVDKYLSDLNKNREKGAPEVEVERDIKLVSKRKRRKSSLKCFRWKAEAEGYGAAWVCKDCGRTMIAQVMDADGAPGAEELAATILLSIEDHPKDGWILWSAYGLDCYVRDDFKLAGQKLMAGLIRLEFEKETEKIVVARWGMANVALRKNSLRDWIGSEMAKPLRKHAAQAEETEIKGHKGLHIAGDEIAGVQGLQRFFLHCAGKLFADRLIARAWHCEETNRIFYIETFVDRENAELVDEIADRIVCHSDAQGGAAKQ